MNMKKKRWIMMGITVLFVMHGAVAQDSFSSDDGAIMLTRSEINGVDHYNKDRILLSNLLSTLENHFDVTFLYRDKVMLNKYVQKDYIKIDEKTGQELSQILDHLGITFQRIDEQTYVLLDKLHSLQSSTVQEEISGTVTDAQSGETLPGVNILVKGTTTGTSTDQNGNYELTAPTLQDTLVATYIGYQRQEIFINGRQEVDIALQPQAISGEEVIITALGLEREARSLGYSVSQVESEDITVNRTTNFVDALQGKIAGVSINSLAGAGPQGSSKVRIRGLSSFGGDNSPLIVVDGVPIDNSVEHVDSQFSSRNSDTGDGFSSINPDNIQEMSVLKGAAASALYGARAKDGVILITTKNRSEGSGIELDYNINFETGIPIDRRDYQMQYGQGEGGERPTSSFPVSGVWSFGEKFEEGMTHTLFDGLEVPYEPQPNQLQEYYRNESNLNNSLNISSGGDNGGYNVSISNLISKSILPGSNYNRNNVSLGFTQEIVDRITLSGNVNYSNEDRENPPNIAEQDYSPVVIYTLANSMPMNILKENCCNENGDEIIYSRFTNRTNPYFALKRFENVVKDRVYGNVTARFDLTEWLYIQGRIGQDFYSRNQEYNLPTGSQRQPPAPPGFVNGDYTRNEMIFRELNADFIVNLNQTVGDYGFNINFGGNQMHRKREIDNTLVNDFFSRGLYALENGRSVNSDHSLAERQVNSLYGSAEVSYRDMVFLTGTIRNDWFSTLSPEERSILYPSITGSFVFSDAFELPDWLTYGKFRASYAEVGSDTDVAPYSNNLFYGINSNFFGNSPLGSISGGNLPNRNLRPMRLSEWEVGFDLTLFDNLTIESSYYNQISKDQILNQQISNASGFTSRSINVGESQNTGIEALVRVTPLQSNDFYWNASINGSYNTSEILDLGSEIGIDEITVGDAEFHGELRQVTGEPMNQLYGWGYLRDTQGRKVFDENTGRPIRSEEQLSFGSSIPNWVGGITNSFNYKNLSFSFLVDFTLGHNLISGTHINAYRHGLDKATLVGREQGYVVGDGVNPDGSENTVQTPVQTYYETIRGFRGSEQSVFKAGSWQLRQASVGYNFTPHLSEGLGLRGIRLTIVAKNIAVLKSWVPHIHPDQNGIYSDQRQGLEATGLPPTTSIGFNLSIQI